MQQYQNNALGNSNSIFNSGLNNSSIFSYMQSLNLNASSANDPYNEHDFGSFNHKGEQIYWKIDYYDKNYQYCSEDPSNLSITNRAMTIMLAEEY